MTLTPSFKKLFDASPNAYLVMTPDFKVVYVNRAFMDATNHGYDELVSHYLFDAFPSNPDNPEDTSASNLAESFHRVLETRAADTIELLPYAIEYDTPGGKVFEKRFWSITNAPLLSDDGEIEFIFQHVVDVTEFEALKSALRAAESGRKETLLSGHEVSVFQRVRAEQEASRLIDIERHHLRRLFQQAPGFIAVMRGPQHVIELANDAFYRFVGDREIIGKSARDAVPEAQEQGFFELLDQVYATGETFVGHGRSVSLQRKPNAEVEELFIDFVYQPVFEADGTTISGIFCQGNDITQQKLAQDRLALHQEQLEKLIDERTRELEKSHLALQHSQKLEAIGKLTGGVAHDFNNILQIIGGNLQLLQMGLAGNAHAQKRLDTAVAAVDHGAKLASQLLAFARRHPLQPAATNLGRVLRDMDELLRRAIGESIEIETIVSGGLWTTMVDPNQLENVILNLAINARDAMKDEGKLTLELGNAMLDDHYAFSQADVPPGQYVMLAISDTGSGMAPEIMAQAFEPFFTTKPEGEGTGLGLSMAYGFVKQSDGHIKIYSEPGHGTTVKIYLPRTHQPEVITTYDLKGPIVGGTETILVVEDDEAVKATAVDMLMSLGYNVLTAKDGQSALTVIQSGVPIDLLFTDVVMPGPVRSPDLARQAKALLPAIEVLFTSGYTQNAIIHGGRLDTGVELLSKPYRREDLARKVRYILGSKRGVSLAATAPSDAFVKAANPLHILVVEDNLDSQQVVCELLMLLGHVAQGVSSGEEALRALETTNFNVLFTDVNLPGMSGLELARKAFSNMPTLKVIFASGYGAIPTDNTEFKSVSLPKPYDLIKLMEVLAKIS